MYLLDIGGGFPGSEDVKLKFEEVWSKRLLTFCCMIYLFSLLIQKDFHNSYVLANEMSIIYWFSC